MLTPEQINRLITDDTNSDSKRFARTGLRYYEGDHDIKRSKMYYYNAQGELVEDTTRSNVKIAHPFFTELVDQEVQYMLSGDGRFVRSDCPELQSKLDEYFNDDEDFAAELYDVLTGCVSKGFEYMYAYKGADGRTRFQCADSMGVVEVRENQLDNDCAYVIYWYTERIEDGNRHIKRIQVWDSKQTTFYEQEENGAIVLDADQPINPRPHTVYRMGDGGDLYYEDYGFIPFFRLDNNRKKFSGLRPIKSLIDDYDLMSCGLSNNLQDMTEALYVVTGFQGDNLDELITNLKQKKQIGVDNGGGVDIKTIDVPYQARQTKLELDERNIYRFGMGFNSAQMGDGNITNVVIKSRYALLDLKCNKLEIRLKQFLRKLLRVVLAEINQAEGTDYQQRDVYFEFEREVMTNASDNATIEKTEAETQQIRVNTLLNVAQTLDDETLMQKICDALDIDYEDVRDKLPSREDETQAAMAQLMASPTEEVPGEQVAEGSGDFAPTV